MTEENNGAGSQNEEGLDSTVSLLTGGSGDTDLESALDPTDGSDDKEEEDDDEDEK